MILHMHGTESTCNLQILIMVSQCHLLIAAINLMNKLREMRDNIRIKLSTNE